MYIHIHTVLKLLDKMTLILHCLLCGPLLTQESTNNKTIMFIVHILLKETEICLCSKTNAFSVLGML